MTVKTIKDVVWDQEVEYRVESFPDAFDPKFMDGPVARTIIKQIERGEMQSFCVRVDFIMLGVVLGTDWLSGCIYRDLNDFMNTIGYFQDMMRNVREYARNNILAFHEVRPDPQ